MSIGTPEPALRHWYWAGHRARGGFFFFVARVGSPGTPGVTFGSPASNEAQGNTQKACAMIFPLASLCPTQRCEPCLQSRFFLQVFPRPAVLGSRGGFFAVRTEASPGDQSLSQRFL